MATALSLTTAQKMVVSLLQASQTAFGATTTGSTPDGSNFQFRSDLEIQNAILTADGMVVNAIIQVPNHPYITTFVTASSALINGANLPARNGCIVKITCLNDLDNITFVDTDVSTVNNTINVTDAQEVLTTGRRVQFSNSGGGLPAPFVVSTDYYIAIPAEGVDGYRFSTTYDNALAGSVIDITTTGTGTQTMILNLYEPAKRGISPDEMTEARENPDLFGSEARFVAGFGLVQGDTFYTSSSAGKVHYADYTLTSSPQAPEPYLSPVVAGAISILLKDGGDDQMCAYYQNIFNQNLAMIGQGAQQVPAMEAYLG